MAGNIRTPHTLQKPCHFVFALNSTDKLHHLPPKFRQNHQLSFISIKGPTIHPVLPPTHQIPTNKSIQLLPIAGSDYCNPTKDPPISSSSSLSPPLHHLHHHLLTTSEVIPEGKGAGKTLTLQMGLAFTYPGDDALAEGLEALFMRSVSFTDKGVRSILRSISFNGRDSEPTILKAFGSGKLIIAGSVSFKEDNDPYQFQTKISIKSPSTSDQGSPIKPSFRASRFNPSRKTAPPESPLVEAVQDCHKHQAAVKLQKVYKSFRTRRQLADCAVLVEQQWWKLLDFALLKQSSVSFFDIDEPETAVSRWVRGRRRAAKVGKGLSQDKKAQKLALQHWLEAIDPRHRYGHNLHFYYNCWLRCESKEPFFYWLDVGGGKEVNLEEKCPRLTLQQQCIKYLGPKEREAYEVKVEDGKFMYKTSGNILDTSEGPKDSKWIFVLSTSKALYVGQKKKGKFQHSSFLAGGATSAAGRLVVDNGILRAAWPHSGHYRPTKENFQELMSFLKEKKVDLTDVQLSPAEDDDEMHGFKCTNSELDLTRKNSSTGPQIEEVSCTSIETRNTVLPKKTKSIEPSDGVKHQKLHKKIMLKNQEESDNVADEKINFSESKRNDWSGRVDGSDFIHSAEDLSSISIGDYVFCKKNLFQEQEEEDEEASVPQESILRRINSHKGMKSYQLGKQLSCKWTTGAGPRIGCVRDYPSELQFRALEQVNLSPRSDRPYPSPRPFMSPRPLPSPRNPSLPTLRKPSLPSPRNPSLPSPRMPEVPLRKVPLLQKPNFCR